MKKYHLINMGLSFLLMFLMSGCAMTAKYVKSPYINQTALSKYLKNKILKLPENVNLLKNTPTQPFVILGTVSAPMYSGNYSMDELVLSMKKQAAAIGADAIINFSTQDMTSTAYAPIGGIYVPITGNYLHAYGDVIIFVKKGEKEDIEPQDGITGAGIDGK